MPTIKNSWIEKLKKKKAVETAPAYKNEHASEFDTISSKRPITRSSLPITSTAHKTLRGVRK